MDIQDVVLELEGGRITSLDQLTVKKLIKIAKVLRVRYSGLRKSEIIENIIAARKKNKKN